MLVYEGEHHGLFNAVADIDRFTLDVEGGQSMSIVFAPTNSSIVAQVELLDSAMNVIASGASVAAGDVVILQAASLPNDDTYTVSLTSTSGSGEYDIRLVLNGVIEEEEIIGAGNDTANRSSGSRRYLCWTAGGGDRTAVRGQIDTDGNADFFSFLGAIKLHHWPWKMGRAHWQSTCSMPPADIALRPDHRQHECNDQWPRGTGNRHVHRPRQRDARHGIHAFDHSQRAV